MVPRSIILLVWIGADRHCRVFSKLSILKSKACIINSKLQGVLQFFNCDKAFPLLNDWYTILRRSFEPTVVKRATYEASTLPPSHYCWISKNKLKNYYTEDDHNRTLPKKWLSLKTYSIKMKVPWEPNFTNLSMQQHNCVSIRFNILKK